MLLHQMTMSQSSQVKIEQVKTTRTHAMWSPLKQKQLQQHNKKRH